MDDNQKLEYIKIGHPKNSFAISSKLIKSEDPWVRAQLACHGDNNFKIKLIQDPRPYVRKMALADVVLY